MPDIPLSSHGAPPSAPTVGRCALAKLVKNFSSWSYEKAKPQEPLGRSLAAINYNTYARQSPLQLHPAIWSSAHVLRVLKRTQLPRQQTTNRPAFRRGPPPGTAYRAPPALGRRP